METNLLAFALATGIGATATMDLWMLARRRLFGMPLPDYGMVGRWIGHMAHGRFRHERIGAAAPIPGERAIGWIAHYAIGVAFAVVLLELGGAAWMEHPTPALALGVGITSVAAPFLLMQPGMGLGIAARRAPRPWAARFQSLVTHTVFGLGLYATAGAMSVLI